MFNAYECPNVNSICFSDSLCPECMEAEEFQEWQIDRHVRTCTTDGFCYTCQCL